MQLNLEDVAVALASPGTVTVSADSPAVVSKTAHGLLEGTPLTFSAATTLPAGMVAATPYYVKLDDPVDPDSFMLTTTRNGHVLVDTTTTGTGTITATATNVVAVIPTNACNVVGIEVKNTGANPLDLFSIYGKVTPTGNEILMASSAGDYSTPVYPIVKTTGAPVTLASGATALIIVDASGVSQLVLKASSGTGATTLEIHAAAQDLV